MAHIGSHEDCFPCKIKSIGFGYRYGQKSFHGPSIQQQRAEAIREAKSRGNRPNELTRREAAEFDGK